MRLSPHVPEQSGIMCTTNNDSSPKSKPGPCGSQMYPMPTDMVSPGRLRRKLLLLLQAIICWQRIMAAVQQSS